MIMSAAVAAILGPCTPLARLLILGRVRGIRALLALLTTLLEGGLARFVGAGVSFLTWTSSERPRVEVLFQNPILCLSHLEDVTESCILREFLLEVVPRTLESIRVEC